MFPYPKENLSAGVSTDTSQCPSSRAPRMRSRMPNGIDICVRIRPGQEKSAILLTKCLVSFLQVRISKLLLMKSFILFCICNKSVTVVSTIEGSLPVDYMLSYADPAVRVSLHLLLRCSQTPHNSVWETKEFLDAKIIHFCIRNCYSSYAEVRVAAFSNLCFVSFSDELFHLHLLFLRKFFFDIYIYIEQEFSSEYIYIYIYIYSLLLLLFW